MRCAGVDGGGGRPNTVLGAGRAAAASNGGAHRYRYGLCSYEHGRCLDLDPAADGCTCTVGLRPAAEVPGRGFSEIAAILGLRHPCRGADRPRPRGARPATADGENASRREPVVGWRRRLGQRLSVRI